MTLAMHLPHVHLSHVHLPHLHMPLVVHLAAASDDGGERIPHVYPRRYTFIENAAMSRAMDHL